MKQIFLLISLFILVSCSNNELIQREFLYSNTPFLQIGINQLKDNGDSYVGGMSLKNVSDSDLLIFVHDFSCLKKDTYGMFRFLDDPERSRYTLLIKAKEEVSFPISCELSAHESKGSFIVRVSKVYENPSGDGRTLGKNILKNLEWSFESPR